MTESKVTTTKKKIKRRKLLKRPFIVELTAKLYIKNCIKLTVYLQK